MSELHPFEQSGCGIGPFKFLGMVSIPRTTLAEVNPEAYNNALKALPVLVGGCGTCYHCGMAIMNICIIKDSAGKLFGVGTTCVEKTGDPSLADPAKVALARHTRKLRQERLAAAAQARVAAFWASPEGIAKRAAIDAQAATQATAREQVRAKWGFLLPHLEDRPGFCSSIARDIRNGFAPSGRAVEILEDIFGKAHGRRGSAAYDAAVNVFDTNLNRV